jgi:hypothetical protein
VDGRRAQPPTGARGKELDRHPWGAGQQPSPPNGGARACRSRMPYFPRPPGKRRVIRRESYVLAWQTTAEAAAGLELLDYDFHLFTEKARGQRDLPDTGRLPAGPGPAAAAPARPLDASITISEHPAPRLAGWR